MTQKVVTLEEATFKTDAEKWGKTQHHGENCPCVRIHKKV